ncbi:MAG: hypothetical protein DWP98_02300 [Bacteroidetes bacterium]|nr:MAG: hypothetical protein DWP98_02300 [Bacteroidota bacterium]MBL1145299.1 hypothetical protein [Bacteroidota bacterium]NOG58096.1 hypothetical protein [Bacteroidota bacterium]
MNLTLKELKNVNSDNCITIILNTHRTSPDNGKDALTLKNLMKDAEERLYADESKRNAKVLVERLKTLASEIDHRLNLESLILFVNEDIAQYTRLPLAVKNRVHIDHTFATRDLVRAMHLETNYYILVLNQEKVRLIEAFNDKLVSEISDGFPMENNQSYTHNKADLSNASRQRNIIAEYFNQVDKAVNKVRNIKPLPILICSEESNYHEYLKVADKKHSFFETYLNRVRLDEKASVIVIEAWKVVKSVVEAKNNSRKEELKKAVSQNKFMSDTNEIWNAIKTGRIQTLFIEQGLFQPAVISDSGITYVSEEFRDEIGIIDDIYDELIAANMDFGGDVVFLPKGELSKFNGFGAITRY